MQRAKWDLGGDAKKKPYGQGHDSIYGGPWWAKSYNFCVLTLRCVFIDCDNNNKSADEFRIITMSYIPSI